jgi:hypothetical protein
MLFPNVEDWLFLALVIPPLLWPLLAVSNVAGPQGVFQGAVE